NAARALAYRHEAALRAMPRLPSLLKDPETEVRVNTLNALSALMRSGDEEAIRLVVTVMNDREQQEMVRMAAAMGLAINRNNVPGAIDAILAVIASGDEIGQVPAVVLGGEKDSRAVEALIAALGAKSPSVRRNAATALGSIGDKRATGPLIEMLREGDT